MKIPLSQLGSLTEIASGTFGRVHRAPQCTLPGDPTPLAYKEFTKSHAEQGRAAEACVDLWKRLAPRDRAMLGDYSVWPRALVVDGRKVCGLLMPLLDDEFFHLVPDAFTGEIEPQPRTMKWLMSTKSQQAGAGVTIPDIDLIDRYALMAKLSYVIALLHRMGWVYGDLSFENVAFVPDPIKLRLLDCDAAAPLSDRTRRQSHTLFWHPPESDSKVGGAPDLPQDTVTDVYKLGLAVMRCVSPGSGGGNCQDPRRLRNELDPAGVALVTRALSADRSARPTAKELYQYLAGLVKTKVRAPALDAELAAASHLRGQDVRLRWTVMHAETVIIEAPNGQRLSVGPKAHPTGFSFRPEGSGPVTVVAVNRFGTTRVEAGDLNLYELPPVRIERVRLPQPEIRALDAFEVPSLPTIAAERPVTEVGAVLGALPAISVSAVLDDLEPMRSPSVAFPRWAASLDRATRDVSATVTDVGASVATAVQAGLQDARWDAGGQLR